MKKLLLFVLMAVSFTNYAIGARPEITYTGTQLAIGTEPAYYKYPFRLSGYKGILWETNNISFNIEPHEDGLYIFSNLNTVDFYDAESNFYNAIRCSRFFVVSDGRIKENIQPLDNVLPKLSAAAQVAPESKISPMAMISDEKKQTTEADIIALIKIYYPELVQEGQNGELLVNMVELIPLLVKSIQELQETIDAQNKRISEIKELL